MCGIAGVLRPVGREVEDRALREMGRAQHHRGPDAFRTRSLGHAGFAHNRLSIVDLSEAGSQPFEDDRYVLVYNGEIYNAPELRAELQREGVEFRGHSDTEALFHCLRRMGVERTLARIRGMFAFGLYDLLEDRLFLVRDRLGIKPLVWTFRGGTLYFASEAKAIAAVVDVSPDPVRALFALEGAAEISELRTEFSDVNNVAPGHYLECRPGTAPLQHRYYDLASEVDPHLHQELRSMGLAATASRMHELMGASVKRMLLSDVPLGVFLSGGVDSGYLASLAARERHVSLFTADVGGRHSEYERAKRTAESLSLPLHQLKYDPQSMLRDWAVATWHYEAPIIRNTHALPLAAIAGVARDAGVKAVLTGEGADELFIGYPSTIKQVLKARLSEPRVALEKLLRRLPLRRGGTAAMAPASLLNLIVQRFERQRTRQAATGAFDFLPERERFVQLRVVEMIREVLVSLLMRNDRMGMLASVESRFPFLDEDVVRFGVNLPVSHKLKFSMHVDTRHPLIQDKAVLRLAARELLPAEATRRMKRGFPNFGHGHLHIEPGFFAGGYLENTIAFTGDVANYAVNAVDRSLMSRLAAIEVFGRLFGLRESVDEVRARCERYARQDA